MNQMTNDGKRLQQPQANQVRPRGGGQLNTNAPAAPIQPGTPSNNYLPSSNTPAESPIPHSQQPPQQQNTPNIRLPGNSNIPGFRVYSNGPHQTQQNHPSRNPKTPQTSKTPKYPPLQTNAHPQVPYQTHPLQQQRHQSLPAAAWHQKVKTDLPTQQIHPDGHNKQLAYERRATCPTTAGPQSPSQYVPPTPNLQTPQRPPQFHQSQQAHNQLEAQRQQPPIPVQQPQLSSSPPQRPETHAGQQQPQNIPIQPSTQQQQQLALLVDQIQARRQLTAGDLQQLLPANHSSLAPEPRQQSQVLKAQRLSQQQQQQQTPSLLLENNNVDFAKYQNPAPPRQQQQRQQHRVLPDTQNSPARTVTAPATSSENLGVNQRQQKKGSATNNITLIPPDQPPPLRCDVPLRYAAEMEVNQTPKSTTPKAAVVSLDNNKKVEKQQLKDEPQPPKKKKMTKAKNFLIRMTKEGGKMASKISKRKSASAAEVDQLLQKKGSAASPSAESKRVQRGIQCETWANQVIQGGREKLNREWKVMKDHFDELKFTGMYSVKAFVEAPPNKKRYKSVLCWDRSRVKLNKDSMSKEHFIHANYVSGQRPKQYIMTQGPLLTSTLDFWRMVWQENVGLIVMLCQVKENGAEKSCQYWSPIVGEVFSIEDVDPEEFSVTTTEVETIEQGHIVLTELALSYGKDGGSTETVRQVYHYQFLSWPDRGVPSSSDHLLNLRKLVKARYREMMDDTNETSPPIVVHCSAGIGRSGAFVAIDIAIDRLIGLPTVHGFPTDFPSIVDRLRTERSQSIQTEEQYFFCHECILKFLIQEELISKQQPHLVASRFLDGVGQREISSAEAFNNNPDHPIRQLPTQTTEYLTGLNSGGSDNANEAKKDSAAAVDEDEKVVTKLIKYNYNNPAMVAQPEFRPPSAPYAACSSHTPNTTNGTTNTPTDFGSTPGSS